MNPFRQEKNSPKFTGGTFALEETDFHAGVEASATPPDAGIQASCGGLGGLERVLRDLLKRVRRGHRGGIGVSIHQAHNIRNSPNASARRQGTRF